MLTLRIQVKCDSNPKGCRNCERLQYECSFVSTVAPSITVGGSVDFLERRRAATACIACRDRRSKCSGSGPSCTRCHRLGLECQYPKTKRIRSQKAEGSALSGVEQNTATRELSTTILGGAQALATSPTASQRGDETVLPLSSPVISHPLYVHLILFVLKCIRVKFLSSLYYRTPKISKAILKQHLDAYFEFILPIPCLGYLHRATVFQAWSKDDLNPHLALAVCGVVSPFLFRGDSVRQRQARHWVVEAETALLASLTNPCLSDVEAWVLVIFENAVAGRYSTMLLYLSLVSRLAYIMRLHLEDQSLPFLERERRRRLFWAIHTLDSVYSSGRPELTSCPSELAQVQLPCKESCYTMDVASVTETLHVSDSTPNRSNLGMVAYCIRVLDIRNRAHR